MPWESRKFPLFPKAVKTEEKSDEKTEVEEIVVALVRKHHHKEEVGPHST